MAVEKTSKIWMNGKFVDWDKATIHVLSHVVHYGSSVFEGIRAYKTAHGPAIFRLRDHLRRFFDSAKIYRMALSYEFDEIFEACVETGSINKLEEFYVRPVAYRGYGQVGVNPVDCPIDVAIAVWKWGKYLGADALEKGVDVRVSSWTRPAPNTFPSMAKSGANYANSQLIKLEAGADGYAEGIALGTDGFVSEGSGENLFVIYRGELYTPPISASILPGVTRDTVLTFAAEMGLTVRIESVPREMLYVADEAFFSGTATEVTPIRSVDRIPVGNGTRGPITEKMQVAFFRAVRGEDPEHLSWLTPVPVAKEAPVLEKSRAR